MDIADDVLIALRRIIRATDLHSKYLFKSSGLTMAQVLLMRSIRNKPRVPIGDLAIDVQLSQATVTTILDRLEKRQLIMRKRSTGDKRKVFISLTHSGLDLVTNSPVLLQEHFIHNFNKLNEWEQTLILSSLQRVAQMMNAETIDASPILDIDVADREMNEIASS